MTLFYLNTFIITHYYNNLIFLELKRKVFAEERD